jgi:hypothetical protein
MTPLLPTPDHYLNNLITMTSSEAKRLWRRSIKEHFGGEDITSNLVCACTSCNQDKGSTYWRSWMRERFGLNLLREGLINQHINTDGPKNYICA